VLLLAAVAWRQTFYWRNDEMVWTRAVSCTEQNSMGHYSLANVLFRQKRTDEAMTHLREAVASYSISRFVAAAAHSNLAELLTAQGKTSEAFQHYEQAVRILPTGAQCHARLAIALAAAGQLDRAIAEWRKTVRLAPTDSRAYLGLADALLDAGDAGEAIALCRMVLSHEPKSTAAIVILGTALANQGKVAQAIPYLEHALELEPRNAWAHFRLGLALHDLGQSSSAIDHLNEAIQIRPDNVLMLWQTAWTLASSPDPKVRDGLRAVELATKAVELSSGQEVHVFDALAAALAETGNFSAAVETAERASAMALVRNDDSLIDAIEQRTRLYRGGLPYRQPASRAQDGNAPPGEHE
jgi:tetratricopeptide (TPR) repeat protein